MLAPASRALPRLQPAGSLQARALPLRRGPRRVKGGMGRWRCAPVCSQQQESPDSESEVSAHLRRQYSGLRKEAEVYCESLYQAFRPRQAYDIRDCLLMAGSTVLFVYLSMLLYKSYVALFYAHLL